MLLLLAVPTVLLAGLMYLDVAGRHPVVLADGLVALQQAESVIARAPRTLIVAAHPDDIEWYMGGTVARLVDAGAEITVIMATNGEARSGGSLSGAALGDARQAEQLEASRRLGVTDVVFLNLPDGGLWRSPQLIDRVREIWQRVEPGLVFSFDYARTRLSYVHPDHLSVGRAVARIASELGVGGHADVWLFHSRQPDLVVDTSEVLERKVQALLAHTTQVGGDGQRLRSTHANSGSAIGSQAGVKYGEAFRRLLLPD